MIKNKLYLLKIIKYSLRIYIITNNITYFTTILK
jgi:hypothetical protein